MKGNIIDYVNQFQYSFAERRFNDVDSLILCQLAYLKMKNLLPGLEDEEEFVPFRRIVRIENYGQLFADERYREDNEKLAAAVVRSRRFADLKLNYYVDILDKEMEVQFSAVTFLLGEEADGEAGEKPDGEPLYYVAYRGTDENLVGWKEDLTLAFSEPVVGQLYAAKYMRKAAAHLPCPFYMGGHSKGGNLAVFAAMSTSAALQEKIRKVYCHDGPGFKPQVIERYEYARIAGKVTKILPKSSMVGMLMEQEQPVKVVESSSVGLFQHNPYTWTVELSKGEFVQAEGLKDGARVMDSALTDWILSLDDEQVSRFADILFQVLAASETDNLIDFAANWKKSLQGIFQSIKNADEETKEEMGSIMKDFLEVTGETTKKEIHGKMMEKVQEFREKFQHRK